MDEAAALIPSDKQDLKTAHRAVEAGWPAVRPVIGELVAWCRDGNWPVARVLAPFLGGLGAAVASEIRDAFVEADAQATYFLVIGVVAEMPKSGVAALASELRRLADCPTPAEVAEDLPSLAREQLARLEAR